MEQVAALLEQHIDKLKGDWVNKSSKYEQSFCDIFGWKCVDGRYYDAIMNDNILIEIKKGKSNMFFDLVRYGEIAHGMGPKGTITIHIQYLDGEVNQILVMDTDKLMTYMSPTTLEEWSYAMKLSKNAHRRICTQEEFKLNDMSDIADYHIKSTKEKAKPPKKKSKKRKQLKGIGPPKPKRIATGETVL